MYQELSTTSGYMIPSSSSDDEVLPAKGTRICRVCGEVAEGAHVGVDSCRACAAFYRRSILLKREYTCKTGSGNCSTANKKARAACKHCRFVRCVAIGMIPENVHQRGRNKSMSSSSSCSIIEMSLPATIITRKDSVATLESGYETCTGLDLELKTSPAYQSTAYQPASPHRSTSQWPLLQWMADAYKHLEFDRHTLEYANFPMEHSDPMLVIETYSGPLRECSSPVLLNGLMICSVPLLRSFCFTIAPEAGRMVGSSQEQFFRDFLSRLVVIETLLRSARNLAEDCGLWQNTLTTYSNGTTLHTSAFSNRDLVQRAISDMADTRSHSGMTAQLLTTFRRLQLSDVEVTALIAIFTWGCLVDADISDDVYATLQHQKTTLFSDLHYYYREVEKRADYSARLGELLVAVTHVQTVIDAQAEEIALGITFDALSPESFVYKYLQRV